MEYRSRAYQTEQDLVDLQAFLMEGRARTSDWRYPHLGELMWHFFMLLCHLSPQEHLRLWHAEQGRLVGYALLGEDPFFDWHFLPEHEGLWDEAFAWAEKGLGELRGQDASRWAGSLEGRARQDQDERMAFLAQHGFRYRGTFAEVNLLRSLDEPIHAYSLPAGYQVRALAQGGETTRRAEAQQAVWLPWTVGEVTGEDYGRFMELPGYHLDLDVVAVAPSGEIAAYVNCWIDPLNRIGDFGPVGAHPGYRRMGLTRAVLFEGMQRLKAHGMQRVCVSTGVANAPARRLYESVGFKIANYELDFVQMGSGR